MKEKKKKKKINSYFQQFSGSRVTMHMQNKNNTVTTQIIPYFFKYINKMDTYEKCKWQTAVDTSHHAIGVLTYDIPKSLGIVFYLQDDT